MAPLRTEQVFFIEDLTAMATAKDKLLRKLQLTMASATPEYTAAQFNSDVDEAHALAKHCRESESDLAYAWLRQQQHLEQRSRLHAEEGTALEEQVEEAGELVRRLGEILVDFAAGMKPRWVQYRGAYGKHFLGGALCGGRVFLDEAEAERLSLFIGARGEALLAEVASLRRVGRDGAYIGTE